MEVLGAVAVFCGVFIVALAVTSRSSAGESGKKGERLRLHLRTIPYRRLREQALVDLIGPPNEKHHPEEDDG
jgi:hypothetical protein